MNGNLQEQIPLYVCILLQVLRSFMNRRGLEFTHVMVLTLYNGRLNLIRALRGFISDVFVLEAVQNLVFEIKSTVAVSQGTENCLVIYTAGRGSDHNGRVGGSCIDRQSS